jgi:hypothetical protein
MNPEKVKKRAWLWFFTLSGLPIKTRLSKQTIVTVAYYPLSQSCAALKASRTLAGEVPPRAGLLASELSSFKAS